VEYTVTASDDSEEIYTVTVIVAPSNEAEILTFVVDGQEGSSVIDPVNKTILVLMPHGTNLTLSPTITISDGATIDPQSGYAVGFTASDVNPVHYVVTAEDGVHQGDYAVTVRVVVTMTYDGNDNTGGVVPDVSTHESGNTISVAGAGTLVKNGSTFVGWNTRADGSGTSYTASSDFKMGTDNVILYAQWTPNPTYAVIYHGNGSTEGIVPDTSNYEQGTTVTVLGNEGVLWKGPHGWDERSISYFIGWNTAEDGSGTRYNDGDQFEMQTSEVNLYAMWEVHYFFFVTYDGNGNSGGVVPESNQHYLESHSSYIVSDNTGDLVKDFYSFAGWYTDEDEVVTDYAAGDLIIIDASDITLHAKWVESSYRVLYDGNGNTAGNAPGGNYYMPGVTVTLLAGNSGASPAMTKVVSGVTYHFTCWNTQADGNGTDYAAGSPFTMPTSNVTMYAKWSPTYTVTYNGNGSTGGTVPATGNYVAGETVTVSGNTGSLVNGSKHFLYWSEYRDGRAPEYIQLPDSTFTMNNDVTLYAIWGVYLTYDGNGNTGGSLPSVGVNIPDIGSTTVIVAGNPGNLMNGSKNFAGWNTAADGTGTTYSAGNEVVLSTSNVTLYAKWILVLAIGDSYQGGKVVYLLQEGEHNEKYSYDPNVQHGLIVSLVNLSPAVNWHSSNTGSPATGTGIGTGNTNTNNIMALYGVEVNAARLCHNYTNSETGTGVYSDWYLPSKDELNQLYLNKVAIGGSYGTDFYWSSSGYSATYVWKQSITTGSQTYNVKAQLSFTSTRAFRSF